MSGSHEQARRAIVSHFAPLGGVAGLLWGRGLGGRARAVRREQAMRAHLPGCAECRAFYERWLLAASIDPAIPSDQDRLARGLGLPVARPPRRARHPMAFSLLAGLAAAAAIAVLVLRPGPGPDGRGARGQGDDGFVARGSGAAGAPPSELVIYRIARAGGPGPVSDAIHATDEVVFGYRNPTGKRHLLVFAVDEHGHVFWYHPAWSDPGQTPSAVAIEATPGLHELPAAISQRYDGHKLSFHALFTDLDLTVRQVEATLAAVQAGEEVKEWPFPDTIIDIAHSVRVDP